MIPVPVPGRRARAALPFPLLLVAALGCGEPQGYPTHLTYPPRQDRVVVRPPERERAEPEAPGHLDDHLAEINSLGGETYDPAELAPRLRSELEKALAEGFGTPAEPAVAGNAAVEQLAAELGLTPERLAEGSRLYRRHCAHCHGLTGDGRGPTGLWIQPHPRDYRQGVFKFVSTEGTGPRKPRRDDLLRTLRRGIKGTSMPAFDLLPPGELDAIVAYVVHLSVRGEAEYRLFKALLSEGEEGLEADVATDTRLWAERALRQWLEAEMSPLEPLSPPPDLTDEERLAPGHLESVRRGYELFVDPKGAGCMSCHADFGRRASFRYDVWGTLVRPRDLTDNTRKGGDRPIDLFHRVRGGIGPSQMPAVVALPEEQVWDLVHFVQALPYPRMLPPDVRDKVYPRNPAPENGAPRE